MRILWLTPGFPADENDHNCIPPMQLLARELVRQGVDLQVIALEYPFRAEPYHWQGIPVWPCDGRNRRWLKLRTLRRAFRVGRQYLNEGPAVLHSFWLGWAARVGERLSDRFDVPHLTTLMGQDVLPANRIHLRHLTQKDEVRLVALSAFHNAVLEKTTGLRAGQVIPWGLSADEIPENLPEYRPIDVLGVGSLIKVKDWARWLHVVRKAADRRPDISAALLGDGPELARLQRLSENLHLQKNVRFAGALPRPEVLKKMQAAKVLLHTSRFESFGFVLAEAAAQGCRTLSTPVGIAPEFDCTGKNEMELAEQLLALLDLPPRQEPLVPFTMRQTARQYLDLYQSLMD